MPKKFLNPAEEGKLSGDMRELYDRILPNRESEENRAEFVRKLERILNQQWPGNEIKVHVFGSSGNMLCTNDSDGMLENSVEKWKYCAEADKHQWTSALRRLLKPWSECAC